MSEGKKSQRRENRVAAMQYIYAWSINRPRDLVDDLRVFFDNLEQERDYYSFAEELIHGVIEFSEDVDEKIMQLASNWDFGRIAKIDLAILRLAVYELLYRKDIPPVVSINEAIDLSKEFSSAESRRFVNGILDKVKGELDRPSRTASLD
ncbi:transcription antitermination factor NusB [Pelagicoccus sp. SDUM812003]|uniref:transcription antitermination factor NusB n=1 Tax=Pelagicoccus sp. SDUM812003 TaxID=3041267 RepID=UPI00280CB19E|nr:transcription antitermination factor NusB [Pelagicoccus sp. SDUM812003]MDQ8202767.1 transcription antitermination factor NusB [Pelagicoccus sp. SDUM812003]